MKRTKLAGKAVACWRPMAVMLLAGLSCGGTFDYARRSYLGNAVVYAIAVVS